MRSGVTPEVEIRHIPTASRTAWPCGETACLPRADCQLVRIGHRSPLSQCAPQTECAARPAVRRRLEAERKSPRRSREPAESCGKQGARATVPGPKRTPDRTPHWDVL